MNSINFSTALRATIRRHGWLVVLVPLALLTRSH